VSATGRWLDPAFLGAVILTGLFQGSTNFTEEITRSKYPSYAEYQKRTSRLLPLPPKG
jgi:steroid 5-alpha reductase family enzyme